jgi:hypothetical protein
MYTPDEMEIIHREVTRLRKGGAPAEPLPEMNPSPDEETRASRVALAIIGAMLTIALAILFVFWEERVQLITIMYGIVWCAFGVLGILTAWLFVKSRSSKDVEDRVCYRVIFRWSFNAFCFGLLIFVLSTSMFDRIRIDIEKQIAAEEKVK